MGDTEDTPLIDGGERGYAADSFFNVNGLGAPAAAAEPTSWWGRLRRRAHENVEGTIDSPLEYTILFLIFANVVLLAVSTLPVDDKCFGSKCLRYGDAYENFFEAAEAVSVVIFTLEYVLRIWTCVEFPRIAAKGPIWGRISYATTFFPIIDIASIAPYWLAMIIGKESPDFTTGLRVFRLVRLLKADKYLNAFEYVHITIYIYLHVYVLTCFSLLLPFL